MPNYCENDLWIRGPKDLLDRIASELKTEEYVFDFNTIIPYPAHWAKMDKEAAIENARVWAMSNEERQQYVEKNGWPGICPGFNAGGYGWRIEHWGTKWNAGDSVLRRTKSSLFYKFDTAWAPPISIVEAFSKKYPEAEVVLKFYERGMAFQGKVRLKGGNILEQTEAKYSGTRGG